MASKLTTTSDTDIGQSADLSTLPRLIGASVAAVIAIFNLGVAFARQDALGLERLVGVAGVVVAPGIGWVLAYRVLRPGTRSVGITGLQFALVAVVIGDVVTALLFVATNQSPIGLHTIGQTLQWAIVGLLFAGLPMFGLIFALALVWGTVVRAVASLLQRDA